VPPLPKLFRTTAFKLSLAYLAVFTLVAGGTIGYLAWATTARLNEQIVETVDAEIGGLAEQYRHGGIRRLVAAVDRRSLRPGSSLYLVASFTGQTMAGNVGWIPAGALDRAGLVETVYRRLDETETAVPHGTIARISVLPGGFRLLVGRDTEERDRFQAVVRRAALSSIGLIIVLGLAGGLFVSRRVLRRIDAVAEASRTIMAGDLARRVPVTGSDDEFDRLGMSLNAMLERIGELMRGLREVSENIAHDLKTPLTRLRNRAEAALRESSPEGARAALGEIIEESDGLIRTFEALLMIARAEAGQADIMGEADLSAIARDLAELYEPVAEEAGAKLILDVRPGLVVKGSRELIGQATANLIDNAIRHGPTGEPGRPLVVEVSARRDGDNYEVTVADNGPGIPEADRERVTGRFVRLEASRSRPGSGLGLSLVAAVARLHGGRLDLQDNAPGLRAVLSLPLRHDPPSRPAAAGEARALPAPGTQPRLDPA